MRELTATEVATASGGTVSGGTVSGGTVNGGTAVDNQWIVGVFDQAQHRAINAEVRAQMAKLVKELQDSVRMGS